LKKNLLKIKAFWDTREGHVKQTRGIINALADITPVDVTDVFVQKDGIWTTISDLYFFICSIFKNIKGAQSSQFDILIGTGSHTHIPMLTDKQKSEKAVTCMTPDWPLGKFFNLCFIPEHDLPQKADNDFITTGPPNTAVDRKQHDPGKGLIVIGGVDKKTHKWNSEEIIWQISCIVKREPDIYWTLSTSPRTPAEMNSMCEKLEEKFSNMKFMPFEQTSRGWIEEQYAIAEYTWVSADSVSMVYEALTAGCHVGVLSVTWKNQNNKIARSIGLLEKSRKIVTFEGWKSSNAAWSANESLNEAERCALEIVKRWWPDRLQ